MITETPEPSMMKHVMCSNAQVIRIGNCHCILKSKKQSKLFVFFFFFLFWRHKEQGSLNTSYLLPLPEICRPNACPSKEISVYVNKGFPFESLLFINTTNAKVSWLWLFIKSHHHFEILREFLPGRELTTKICTHLKMLLELEKHSTMLS